MLASPLAFANGEIDIALSRNDRLVLEGNLHTATAKLLPANIRVSPCTPLHTMIIIRRIRSRAGETHGCDRPKNFT